MHIHESAPENLKPHGEYNVNAEKVLCEGICVMCGLTFFTEINL